MIHIHIKFWNYLLIDKRIDPRWNRGFEGVFWAGEWTNHEYARY